MKGKNICTCLAFLLPVIVGLSACYPGGPTSADERDLVVTVFDQNANFGAVRTYAMPDQIIVREGSEEISEEAGEFVINEVARNMAQVGYVRELNPEQNGADVVVLVGANRSTNFVAYGNWGYGSWGFWPGWGYWPGYGPGWGIGYPWVSVGSYETGSVFITMVDPNQPNPSEQEIPAIWGAAINGLLGSTAGNQAFITQTVEQAFRQSPYLGRQ
jgi:hypothetical protein